MVRKGWAQHVSSRFALLGLGLVLAVACALGFAVRRRPGEERDEETDVPPAVPDALPDHCGPVEVAAGYAPGSGVGGDFYEVLHTPFGVRAIVGDVSGRGAEAVRLAREVLKAFRELAQHETGIAGIAFRIDAVLSRRPGERFVTALFVQIAADGGHAELVGCGHVPPLIVRGGRVLEPCELDPALPLGLQELDSGFYGSTWIPFQPGDGLLLRSDGFDSAYAPSGEPYPFEDRATELGAADPPGLLAHLVADATRFTGTRPRDDLTLLYLQPDPARTAVAPRPRMPGPEWAN